MFGIKKRTLRTWIEDGRITPCLRVRYDEDFFTEEEVARAAQWKYGSKQ
jgi:predicted site-specific integrase-resolvase